MRTETQLVPTVSEIIGPGIDALVAQRPRALSFINAGKGWYSLVFAGIAAQAQLMLRRQADEVRSSTLGTAVGQGLIELAASEYETSPLLSGSFAVGELQLHRASGTQGTIRKGHRFRRPANPDARPLAKTEIAMQARWDVLVNSGQLDVTVPVIATKSGLASNIPVTSTSVGATDISSVDTLFDAGFVTGPLQQVLGGWLGGGADAGIDEAALVRAASAYASGQYGPTIGAIFAGALRVPGIRNIAVLDSTSAAATTVYASDGSWAYSNAMNNALEQELADSWQGFGCELAIGLVANKFIQVVPTVTLRDAKLLSDTSGIDVSIRNAVASFFDERPDWWTWKLAHLRAYISKADRRILTCTNVVVNDANTGTPLSEPVMTGHSWADSSVLTHYNLADKAIATTYQGPT